MDLIRDFCPALGFLASRLVFFYNLVSRFFFFFFLQFGQDTSQRRSKEHFWPALGFWAQNGFQGVAYIGVTTNFFLLVVFLFFFMPTGPKSFLWEFNLHSWRGGEGGGKRGNAGG